MIVGRSNIDVAPSNWFLVLSEAYGKRTFLGQDLWQDRWSGGQRMQDDENRGIELSRQARRQLLQCFDTARGCSNNYDIAHVPLFPLDTWSLLIEAFVSPFSF